MTEPSIPVSELEALVYGWREMSKALREYEGCSFVAKANILLNLADELQALIDKVKA